MQFSMKASTKTIKQAVESCSTEKLIKSNLANIACMSSYIRRRPQNFAKSPFFCIGQIYGGDFAKFCGLLRIYELQLQSCLKFRFAKKDL